MSRTQITFSGAVPSALRRKAPNAFKQANRGLLRQWWRDFLPRHFEPGAVQRYQYQRRSTAYARQKRKRNLPPLVWSGQLRDAAERQIRISGTSKSARGRLPGTQIANFNRGQNGRPDVRDEVTRVTNSEQRQLNRGWRDNVNREFRQITGRSIRSYA